MSEFETVKDIQDQAEEVIKWKDSPEKSMALKALGSMLITRGDQTTFIKGVHLNLRDYHPPGPTLFHFSHNWLEYDDTRFFDGVRRICTVCGRTDASVLNRRNAYYLETDQGLLNLDKLKVFIQSLGESKP